MPTVPLIHINHNLLPLSFLYGLGVRFRNQLFDWGLLKGKKYPIPIISIGNLAVGGTGKTPHTEYLIRLLSRHYRLAVLSRGYKRKSSGFLLATSHSTSRDIGDEPFQMKQKFPSILVAVDADRQRGIETLLNLPQQERPEVILLDDAFQHRYVIPSLSILLTDYHCPYYSDKLLPAGRLREPIEGALRADIVVVTKCVEGMTPLDFRIIEENLHLMANQELFFSHVSYENLKALYPQEAPNRNLNRLSAKASILLVSGIASPAPLIQQIKSYGNRVETLCFPDHHDFSQQDFRKIQETFDRIKSSDKFIVATEKDAARLWNHPLLPKAWRKVLYYLPINIQFFLDKQQHFDNLIIKHIQSYEQQNRNSNLR